MSKKRKLWSAWSTDLIFYAIFAIMLAERHWADYRTAGNWVDLACVVALAILVPVNCIRAHHVRNATINNYAKE